MEYAPEDDDTVIWQCSQAVELKRIFEDAPVPTAPPPSRPAPELSTRVGTGSGPHGVKRKRRPDQDTPSTTSPETLGLIQQLSRTLKPTLPSNSNPARRNTRVASAGNINFGMPPPKPKARSSDETSVSDGASFNRSRSSTTSPLVIGKSILEPNSDSSSTSIPCTPPNRILSGPRPATEPTIPVSVLLDHARAESPELPPPPVAPAKPVISIRTDADTVNRAAFSSRSNTSESTTSTTGSGSFVSTTAPISPATPLVSLPPRPETPDENPILDLTEISPTPSPEPKVVTKAPSKPKTPTVEAPVSKPPTQASRPTVSAARATTEPNPPKRPPVLASQHANSEPSQLFKPPTQVFKPPTQQAFKPPTQTTSKLSPVIRPTQQQQYPRSFPSSQTRLGMGALGKGYAGVNKPFKVPNKGKGSLQLTVVPLPKRDGGMSRPSSPSRKKENIDAGRGKRGNSPAPAARPNRPTSGHSSRTTSGSSSRTSGSTARGKPTQSRNGSGSKRELGSDDYIGSDESFDADAVDADMAFWDSWDD